MMATTIVVSAFCSYFVGPPKWKMLCDWVFEPDDCDTEFTFEATLHDWLNGTIEASASVNFAGNGWGNWGHCC